MAIACFDLMSTCGICFAGMTRSAIGGGCAHHFCLKCYSDWSREKRECPKCRSKVVHISSDLEYDKMLLRLQGSLSAETMNEESDDLDMTPAEEREDVTLISIQRTRMARASIPAGVTLGSRGLDLIVLSTVFGDGFSKAGLYRGTVIDTIDGIRHGVHAFPSNIAVVSIICTLCLW